MSIYGSTWETDAEDHAEDCARWLECACDDALAHRRGRLGNDGRHWDLAGTGTCLCGPLVYRGSHVLPASIDKRGGSLGFAEIAGWITRDGRDDGPEDEDRPWPYLRITVRAEDADEPQDVILDWPLINTLTDYLVRFRERCHRPVVDVHLPDPSREDTPA